jgi:hypothetical protein
MPVDPLHDAKPFELWPLVPPALQAVLPNVTWDRARLQALTLPVREVPLAELRWQLDLPWWTHGMRLFAVTPNQVRYAPEVFTVQWRRTLDSDLDYPINVLDRGRLVLLDGVHRLLKADVLEMRSISARIVDERTFASIIERR